MMTIFVRIKSNYTLDYRTSSINFQPSTIKPDNIDHPIIKTEQIWPLDGFQGGFIFFLKKIKNFQLDLKNQN